MREPPTIGALVPWFGSKRILAPEIVRELGPHRAYWEPFCGSMAVLLAKPPSSLETVNDLHRDLVNLAMILRHPRLGPRLYRELRRFLCAEETFSVEGVHALVGLPEPVPGVYSQANYRRARAYFVASWLGRSGVAGTRLVNHRFCRRFTKNGGSPSKRWAGAVDSIPAWRRRLRQVTVLSMDGFDLLGRVEDAPGNAVYADPPYFSDGRKHAGGRYMHRFGEARADGLLAETDDHARLAAVLGRYRQTRVVVSYYEDPRLEELYPPSAGWVCRRLYRAKHLAVQNRRGACGARAPEVLILNGPSLAGGEGGQATLLEGDA